MRLAEHIDPRKRRIQHYSRDHQLKGDERFIRYRQKQGVQDPSITLYTYPPPL